MKCYCYETDADFIFCVEGIKSRRLQKVIQHTAFKKNGGKFLLSCPQNEISNPRDKELVSKNFALLGPAMFKSLLSGADWERPLALLARIFNENGIEWHVVGSVCDVVRGIKVKPFDMDIVVNTRDFTRARELCYSNFPDSVILQFSDNARSWPLRCFGRLFLAGTMIDLVADEGWNMDSNDPQCETISWNGYDIRMLSLQCRYQTEIARKRKDRIKAIEKYMESIS